MSYSITLPDTEPKTYQRVNAATDFANAQALQLHRELKVVHDETGAVVHVATYVPAGQHFAPWERVETPKTTEAPDFEGYVPAYSRKRIGAWTYRPLNKGDEWLVYDGRTKNSRLVANTVEACKLMGEMRRGLML